jgi:hypothetical protein
MSDREEAAVLRALLSRGAQMQRVTVRHPFQPAVRGYELYLNQLALPVVLDGKHADAISSLAGVTSISEREDNL